jgi:hypothetical protein
MVTCTTILWRAAPPISEDAKSQKQRDAAPEPTHLTFHTRFNVGTKILRKLIAKPRVVLLTFEPLVEQRRHHAPHFGRLEFFVIGWLELICVFNYLLTLYLGKVLVSHTEELALPIVSRSYNVLGCLA